MPKRALIFAWTIVAVGAIILAAAASDWPGWNSGTFLVWLCLASVAATFKLRLPNLTGTPSPAFVFVRRRRAGRQP